MCACAFGRALDFNASLRLMLSGGFSQETPFPVQTGELRKLLNSRVFELNMEGSYSHCDVRQPFDLLAITNTTWQREGPPEIPPAAFVQFGSAGKTRTYNPSVNSRMLCH